MDLLTTILIGLGLAMDCFAVSITSGSAIKKMYIKNAAIIAFFFGFFQAIMPLIGWVGGTSLEQYISSLDHWIAFGILAAIGSKMILEAFENKLEKKTRDALNIKVLVILAIATSIDALAVGVSFAFLDTSIFQAVAIIGGLTFSLSFAGVYIRKRFGHIFENRIEIIGGLILIGIGSKILLEHLFF